MHFNRFDICAAYRALGMDYNIGGVLHERGKRRKNRCVGVQLARMGYRHSPLDAGDFDSLNENAQEIYRAFVTKHKLPE